MIPLLNAIYTAFNGDGSLSSDFPGGLHRDQAPQGTAMPYLVTNVVESAIEYGYFGPSRVTVRVRFSAYGVGHDATGSLMESLAAAFDDVPLSLSSGVNDTVTRLGDPMPTLHKQDGQGNDVWQWSVIYEYGVTL